MMDLKTLYPEVRELLESSIPEYWPEMKVAMNHLFAEPMLPEAILPLASCQAVNGDPRKAIHVTAAGVALGTSLRIVDDLADKDKPGELWGQVGEARAWNYASSLHTISFSILRNAPLSVETYNILNQVFIDTFLYISAGQDRDITDQVRSIDDYWLIVKMKTASAYQLACKAGALVGTDDTRLIQACSDFGSHLGFAIQVFNDLESIWQNNKAATDLKRGKLTLPLLYGLQFIHPGYEELLSIVNEKLVASKPEKIKKILDKIDTKGFLIWVALKEREQALESINICPNKAGKKILESYITGMFGDINFYLKEELTNQDL